MSTKLPHITGWTVEGFVEELRNGIPTAAIERLPNSPEYWRDIPGFFLLCEGASERDKVLLGPAVKRRLARLVRVLQIAEDLKHQIWLLGSETDPPKERKGGRPVDVTADRIRAIGHWIDRTYRGKPRSVKAKLADVVTACLYYRVPLESTDTAARLKIVENALRKAWPAPS